MLDLQSYDATFGACWYNEDYDQLSLHHKRQNLQYLVNLFANHPYKLNNYDGELSITCSDVAYDMFRLLKDKGITKISFDRLIDKFVVSDFNIYGVFNKDDINLIRNNVKRLVMITPIEITDWEVTTVLSKSENHILHNRSITIDKVREMNKFYYEPKSILVRMRNFNSLIVFIHGLFNQYKDEFENLHKSNIIRFDQEQIDKYRDFIELFMELSKIYHEKIDWYNKCSYQRLVDLGEREPNND